MFPLERLTHGRRRTWIGQFHAYDSIVKSLYISEDLLVGFGILEMFQLILS